VLALEGRAGQAATPLLPSVLPPSAASKNQLIVIHNRRLFVKDRPQLQIVFSTFRCDQSHAHDRELFRHAESPA
jgi:hypothetical protein